MSAKSICEKHQRGYETQEGCPDCNAERDEPDISVDQSGYVNKYNPLLRWAKTHEPRPCDHANGYCKDVKGAE